MYQYQKLTETCELLGNTLVPMMDVGPVKFKKP